MGMQTALQMQRCRHVHRNLCLIPLWHHLPCLLPQQSSTGGVQEPAVLQHPPTRISSSEQVHTSLHVNHLQKKTTSTVEGGLLLTSSNPVV
jgi:hypothetical protein